jgi:uncharacterized membrane protein (DUF2068 family)
MPDPHPSSVRTLRAIAILKWFKAAALIAVGIGLLQSGRCSLFAGIVHAVRSPVLDNAFSSGMQWLASLSPPLRGLIDVGTFLYALLFAVEGVGLWRAKRWAEWLTVITTSLLIPVEIIEIVHRPTWERVTLFVINVAIVVYLIARMRRGPHSSAR